MHFKERDKNPFFIAIKIFFWLDLKSELKMIQMHRTLDSYRQLGSWICDYKETLFANGVLNADGTLNHA